MNFFEIKKTTNYAKQEVKRDLVIIKNILEQSFENDNSKIDNSVLASCVLYYLYKIEKYLSKSKHILDNLSPFKQ